MSKNKYVNKIEEAWANAKYCNCSLCGGNPNQHRLCPICGEPMQYGSHESVKLQNGSKLAWNVDHKIPLSKGGKDTRSNRQAVHIKCNRNKGCK